MHYFTTYSTSSNLFKILMSKSEFVVYDDLFVKRGYGAFMLNLPENIETIEQFHNYDKENNCNRFGLLYYLENNEGYEFVIGPPAPNKEGELIGNGLYCSNYKELIYGKQKKR